VESETQSRLSFHIVLIEDNPGDVYLIREALSSAGLRFEMTLIDDGGEALRFAQSTTPFMSDGNSSAQPDLILMDLNLPKHEAPDVLVAFRENPLLKDVPVAILTSSSSPADRARAHEFDVAEYILKSPDLDEFFRIGESVAKILHGRSKAV
jgi:CheY-like chemotaxis protein